MIKRASVYVFVAIGLAAQTQPIFRTGSRLIQVDVVVQNNKGAVRGLTKDDFTLLDRGKTQPIAMFAVTDSQAKAGLAAPLPANAVSNRMNIQGEATSAITVILYDRSNTGAMSQAVARKQVLSLLASLKATDRVAFYSLDTRLVLVHPFTRTSEPLVRTARQLDAQADTPQTDPTVKLLSNSLTAFQGPADNPTRVNVTYGAFRVIARTLDGIPGRKNLIWMTASIPFTYGTGAERRENDELEFNRMVRVLSEANIALYPVDPRGTGTSDFVRSGIGTNSGGGRFLGGASGAVTNSVNSLAGTEGLERMADETGGKAFYNLNDVSVPGREILDSAEVTYTLGFYADEKTLDGKVHDLSVKLGKKASGAKVFHRKYYVAQPPSTLEEQLPTMSELVADEADATGIGIIAATAPDPARPGIHLVQVKVKLSDLQLEHQGSRYIGGFDLGLASANAGSSVSVKPISLNLTEDQMKQALIQGIVIDNTVPSPEKDSQLRVVVQDKTRGTAGSVRIPIGPK